jgi:hypothetical protein
MQIMAIMQLLTRYQGLWVLTATQRGEVKLVNGTSFAETMATAMEIQEMFR